MLGKSSVLLIFYMVGNVLPAALPSPSPHHLSGLALSRPLSASQIELQRAEITGGSNNDNDYSDAIYAARFARHLDRLEKAQKGIYVDFISSGFMHPEIPRHLPHPLQSLTRTSVLGRPTAPFLPPPSSITITSSSSSSFGIPGSRPIISVLPPTPFHSVRPSGFGKLSPFARGNV